MSTYKATVLLNLDNPFRAYDGSARLFASAQGTFVGEVALAAADKAWAWGNKQAADADGNQYPPLARSLSVGDVVLLTTGDSPPVAFAVEGVGWKQVDASSLVRTTLKDSAVLAGAVSPDFES